MKRISRMGRIVTAMLALAAGLTACGGGGGAEGRQARKQVEALAAALDFYCLGNARYPESITDATVVGQLTNAAPGLSFTDPWGRPIGYASTGPGNCEVWSAGPDGLAGTPDDIRIRRGAAAP
jgi:hypothetical protein